MGRFRSSDGVTLSYLDEGQGRLIVLVHGYTAPAAAWALTSDALVASGYRVVAFDRRGHGESESPAFGARMARHGRDLGDLLEHLDVSDATLVGASMGGNTIWAYLDQFGSDRVRAVVVAEQTPKMLNSPDWPYGFYGYNASNAGTLFADGAPATGQGRDRAKSQPGRDRLTERLGRPPAFADPTAPEMIRLLTDHALQDWRDVVARVERPVLMIAARQSQHWPCEHAEAAIAGNPFGRAVIIEDCGHTIDFDQPDRFHEVLFDFLRDTS
jgi:pimeloyl-ACP methyl ester carboxylesterase